MIPDKSISGLRKVRQDRQNKIDLADKVADRAEEIIKHDNFIKYAEIVNILELEGYSQRSISSAAGLLHDRGLLYNLIF